MKRNPVNSYLLAALFLVSLAVIAYELYVMRVFSIGSWSNFGSLIISTALLGVGLAGTLLVFWQKWVTAAPSTWFFLLGQALPVTMVLAHVVAQTIPLNPLAFGSDSIQLVYIGLYYLIYGVPFFTGALFISAAFLCLRESIYRVYFWNMIGSGIGGLFITVLMYFLPPASLILPILLVLIAATFFTAVESGEARPRPWIDARRLMATGLNAVVCVMVIFIWGDIRVSEFKSISYIQKFPDSTVVHHSYSPTGEYTVFSSSALHFAPGLSDNAALNVKKLPTQPYWGLYIDGNGPTGIMGKLQEGQTEYFDYLPMAAPYAILDKPNVLLVNLGGGISAQMARAKQASHITVVEPDNDLIHVIRDAPAVAQFTGNLLKDPSITLESGNPRAYSVSHPQSFDIVEISLIDSIGLSASGGYPVVENFTYTVEAIKEYLTSLKPGGVLSITVWNRLNPPRNVPKLLTTINQALVELGVTNPAERVVMFDLFLSTATILVKNSDFTKGDIYDLDNFIKHNSFNVVYMPGMAPRDQDLGKIMAFYRQNLTSNGQQVADTGVKPTDLYYATLQGLFAGKASQIIDQYVFDVRPMRDERPYYSGYLKLTEPGLYVNQMPAISEEWGYVLVIGVFLQSILFGLFVVLVPLIGSRQRQWPAKKSGTAGVILYFAGLGLGYMLIELFLIQRLSQFLSDPTFATSIVITTMLIVSALGNIVSGRLVQHRRTLVMVAAGVVVASMLFYIIGLPALLDSQRNASFIVRVLLAVLVIGPAAFFMGVPFPNGLANLEGRRAGLLPWALAMNGGLSVTGAALARLISVTVGFNVLLIVAATVYAGVGFLYEVNQRSKAKSEGSEGSVAEPATTN